MLQKWRPLWRDFILKVKSYPSYQSFQIFSATEELSTMKRMIITDANAAAVSNRLKNITADRKFLNKHDVVLALDILEKVVDQRNISGEVSISTVRCIDLDCYLRLLP